MKTLNDVISTVWIGKVLRVVNFGSSYGITNGNIVLTSSFISKRSAISRALDLEKLV